ncbi:MAG: hypothetical protein ACKO96_38075, partial [Flammeovirgaceae bacterium]
MASPLSATGSNLLWYASATGGVGSATAPTPSTATPGVASFFVTQTVSGCESARAQLDVTVNPIPSAPTVAVSTYCVGDIAIPVTAVGSNLLWYSFPTGGVGTAIAPTPSTALAGNISFYVSQTISGCESPRAQTDVEIYNPPDVSLGVAAALGNLCTGGSTTIDVSASQPGVNYQLRIGVNNIGPFVVGTGGAVSLPTGTLSSTTTFNVLAYHAASLSCAPVQLTATATVTVGGTINAGLAVAPLAASVCSGSGTSVRITSAEAGVTYQLRDNATNTNVGASVVSTGGNLDLPTGNLTATTTFNVLASSATCSVVLTNLATVTVTTTPNATLAVAGPTSPICPNTSTTITLANSESGVNYQLRSGATNIGVSQNGNGGTLTFTTGPVSAVSTFNILATVVGCSPVQLTATATVTLLPSGDPNCGGGGGINCGAFTITVTDTRPTCNNQNNGQIIIAVSGGSPNYTVTLSDPTIGYNRALVGNGPFVFGNPLVANGGLSPSLNYKYTVLDQAGNTCTQPYSLPVQSTVQAIASTFVDAPCNGQSTGSAKITITSGGTPPYEYSIDGGATFISGLVSGNIINNLPPNGTYNILVRDDASDQCPATVSVTINNANAAIAATVTSTSATCASNDGSIIVAGVGGGVSPYTYQLNGNPVTLGTGGRISNLVAGNYTVSIFDALLCKKDFPISVLAPGFVNT